MTVKMMTLGLMSCMMLTLGSCAQDDIDPVHVDMEYANSDAEVASWPHALYTFDKKGCTSFQTSADQAGVRNIEVTGDYKTVVAYESDHNLDFTTSSAGYSTAGCYVAVKDMSQDIPQIYAGKSLIGESNVILEPVTALLSVNILNGEDIESLTIRIPNMTDAFYPASIKTECVESVRDKVIVMSKGCKSGSYALLPILGKGSWGLYYSIAYSDGGICEGSLLISEFIRSGDTLGLSLDLARSVLTYESRHYGSSENIAFSQTITKTTEEGTEFINANPYYNVYVEENGLWHPLNVHNALCSDKVYHDQIWNDWSNSKKLRDTMCFARIINSFRKSVKVRVEKRGKGFSSVEVRPSSYKIAVDKISDNIVEFTLPDDKSRKVSVEFDGDRQHNLFLFGGNPDSDKPSGGNVIYYGPGEHTEEKLVLTDNQILYVEEGAVLYTCVEVNGDNVTIAGNGIISGEKLEHKGNVYAEGPKLISVKNDSKIIKNFTIKDITLIDSPNWTLSLSGTKGALIDNVNIISWILNGDGIDLTSCQNTIVMNCFIRTYDDCLSLKVTPFHGGFTGNTENVNIENCILWCDLARCVMVGPEAGDQEQLKYSIKNCGIRNSILLESRGTGLAIGQEPLVSNGAAMPIEGITFNNITADNINIGSDSYPIYLFQSSSNKEGCLMNDITFQDIHFDDKFGFTNKVTINSENAAHSITDLRFINVTHNCDIFNRYNVVKTGNGNIQIK